MNKIIKRNIELKIVSPLIGEKIPLPAYATELSAGLDLRACIEESVVLNPGETTLINTGLAIFINDPCVMFMLVPRSGLGHKHGIILSNSTGIIDGDYQNEIFIGLWNRGKEPFVINPGDRVCQGIFVQYEQARFTLVKEFSEKTKRYMGGFGHTGIK